MNILGFQLINLTDDEHISLLKQITIQDIELACQLFKIKPQEISVYIIEGKEEPKE